MCLWSTTTQQINEGRVKGHNGVTHVDPVVVLVLNSMSVKIQP